jgi:hypothetical protein
MYMCVGGVCMCVCVGGCECVYVGGGEGVCVVRVCECVLCVVGVCVCGDVENIS